MQFLPPSLMREKSGAQFFSCVFYGVSKASADVETQAKEAFCRLWLLRPEESVSLRFLVPSPGTSFSLSGGAGSTTGLLQ